MENIFESENLLEEFTLIDLLQWRAIHQPERCAYKFLADGEIETAQLSYRELNYQACLIATRLRSLGVSGERVLLLYPPGLEYIAGFFGCLYAGFIAIPAYPPRHHRSTSRIQSIIVDAQPKLVLTTASVFSELEQLLLHIPELKSLCWLESDQVVSDQELSWQAPLIDCNALAYLQYTSGSTSSPKGIMVSHKNVLYNSECIRQGFELTADSISVSWLPHFHDMGMIDGIIQPLYSGYIGFLMPPVSFLQKPLRWLQAISQYKATHSGGPNFAYELCASKITPEQKEGLDLGNWQSAYNGAEPIRSETLERFTNAFNMCGFRADFFYPCYGLAEATLMVSGGLVKNKPVECVAEVKALEKNQVINSCITTHGKILLGCGQSWLDTNIVIAQPESQKKCATREIGEIWVSGTSVAQGYWQRADQTKEVFQAYLSDTGEGPFLRTGDLGFIQDGELFVTGRLKDLLIIRGRNHYPQDIELTVEKSHIALREGCGAVVELFVESEQELLVIQEVERSFLKQLNVEEIASAIRQSVAQNHELQVYAIVLLKTASIPKTSSGKIQRHACLTGFEMKTLKEVGRSILKQRNDLRLSYEEFLDVRPENSHQQISNYLQQQVSRLLKIAPSQLNSQRPLIRLGLDSLMVVELKYYLENIFGVTVTVEDLFEDSSIAQLATKILVKRQDSLLQTTAGFVPLSELALQYPLSQGQAALWLMHQLAPQISAYNTFFAARILSDLDVEALRQAFQTVSDRHSSIRVTFNISNDQPAQKIQQNLKVFFEEVDGTGWNQDELQENLTKSVHNTFDLEKELPIRVRLFRHGPKRDILLITAHHIAIDFWSLEVLLYEIGILYPNIKIGLPKLPKLDWQYADYVRWQKDMLASYRGDQLWNYWQQQLAGELPVLNLPTDRPRSSIQTYQGAVHTFQLKQDLVESLKLFTQTQGVTLYMLLLAVFQVLLCRYTAQEDILVGSPTSGRNRTELSEMIGYFVNSVVLRVNLSQNPTFEEFLDQVKRIVLEALEYQEYPLSLLVERLQPERNLSYSPLFQVMFVLERSRKTEDLAAFWWGKNSSRINLGGLILESVAIEQQVALFDLTLTMLETDKGLVGSWQYNSDLFDASTIARMAEQFQNLLAGIMGNPGCRIHELPLLSDAERHKLLTEWNRTQYEYPQHQCIHQLFEVQVERTPTSVALVFEDRRLTYQELNCQANQLAHHLQRSGVNIETLVGIHIERSIEMVIGLLGILKAGGAYVPLDPSYPQERLASILSDARLQLLITSEKLIAELPQCITTNVILLDRDWKFVGKERQDNPIVDNKLTNLAYILYTSGSTGQPKGVMIEHRSTVNFLNWVRGVYSSEQLAGVLASTSINFDLSVFEIFAPLCWGGQVIIAENALHLPTLPARDSVTLLNTVPSVITELLRMNAIPNGVRTFNLAGEPLSLKLIQQLYQQYPNANIFNLYGPTEATTYATFTMVQQNECQSPTIGRPLANTQIYILDRHLQLVPIGVPGELYIGGNGLARGYLNRPELTEEKFIPTPFENSDSNRLYKTGDLARYLPDGNIEFLGRLDNQVKIRGFRIELGEIEALLAQHPKVQDNVVLVREHLGEQCLVAYVVPQQSPAVINELRYFLKQKLPQYMIPFAFVDLDFLPLTLNGKIDRRALLNLKIQAQIAATSTVYQMKAEQLIADIWKELLHVENVGIYDNFFDVGGHSLLMTQVCGRLQKTFDKNISMVDMFKYPTISDLAKYFTQKEHEGWTFDVQQQQRDENGNQDSRNLDVAIIGMSCRFPGSPNIEAFWQNLQDGVESISFFSDAELLSTGIDPELFNHPNYVKSKFILPDIELFDAAFFGFSPKEAEVMDPQHRFFLEVSWEALESAGYNPKSLVNKTGIYAGAGMNTYSYNNFNFHQGRGIKSLVDEYQAMIGNDRDFLSTRVSYKLNLSGPSLNVQTACSTSLVAVHLACQSLRNRECDMALAGGVSIRIPQQAGYLYQEGMILSPDGHCRAFDAQAQGTVPGNGLGIVVLKRLAEAIADGDCIHAIIKGSAINNDGSSKVGYTVPSVDGQAAVIADAQVKAGVAPETITYIEAHGTGTLLGDPIEITALKQAFQHTKNKGFCAIGSVKTNIGHLDAASGIAGLLKTVLALKHKLLPPSLHFQKPNPQIDFADSPFYVNAELCEWKTDGIPRRAGVSSFGIGGTNAHIVLEEAASEYQRSKEASALGSFANSKSITCKNEHETERPWHLLTLSAKSDKALEELILSYQSYLATHLEENLADICFTANVGRAHFGHRLALVANSTLQLSEQLTALASASMGKKVLRDVNSSHLSEIAFLFTGQGSQYAGMGQQLYQTQKTFREAIDQCQEILIPFLSVPLLEILTESTLIDQTANTQPALFAIEYALFQLWQSWGIAPTTVMGHSIGEYVAACVAGVFSLEDGLKLIAAQGRLMQSLPEAGSMVAVFASEDIVREAVQAHSRNVAIAAINAPNNLVISGESSVIETIVASFLSQGIETRNLPFSHAFHSPLMQPILAEFEKVAQQISYSLPHLNIVSNVTGEIITQEIATPQYWCRHIQQPVKFAAGMETLSHLGCNIFLEIGPMSTLLVIGRQCVSQKGVVWLPSLHPKHSDWQQILQSLSELYVSGVNIDWSSVERDYARRRVTLPTYPFQRQYYWVDAERDKYKIQEQKQTSIVNLLNQGNVEKLANLLENDKSLSPELKKLVPNLLTALVDKHQQELKATSVENWFYHLDWKAKSRHLPVTFNPTQIIEPGTWLILADQKGIGERLAKLLEKLGHQCLLVFMGNSYKKEENASWIIDPSRLEHFETFWQNALSTLDFPLQGVVHLWSLETIPTENLTIPALEQAQIINCGSVLNLLQTLIKHHSLVSPRLWLATMGAVPVELSAKSIAVAQSSVWGLGKVIALEHSQLWGGLIDLDTDDLLDNLAARLLEEIGNSEGEDHLAFRGGQRYIARLQPHSLPATPRIHFRSDSTYLITGGLGALGLKLAMWMIDQGAKHLVLASLHGASSGVQKTLHQIEQVGVKILVTQTDVSRPEDMVKLFEEAQATMPPFRGVIHAAGILNDGTLQSQDWEMFMQTMAPKVQGSWNLHTLTQEMPLDFFILFSSAASLLGSPGQGNYAAANAFMDNLAHYRRQLGLTGISINWGQWAETGMSANLGVHQTKLISQGFSPIQLEQGLQALECLLNSNSAQIGVLPLNWSLFPTRLPLLKDLLGEVSLHEIVKQPSKQHEFLDEWEKIPKVDRQDILMNHIQEQVSNVLGMKSFQASLTKGFADMGLDSLMAIQLRNLLEKSLGVSLPTTLVFEYPNIQSLTEYIATNHLGLRPIMREVLPEDDLALSLLEIEQLTEAEAQAAIAKEMVELRKLLKET
jgi:amino acid adenylation domain-containing protein